MIRTVVFIDEATWYRGHGPDNSALVVLPEYREYGEQKMCCLGFASCQAWGQKEEDLIGEQLPLFEWYYATVPEGTHGALAEEIINRMATTNDNPVLPGVASSSYIAMGEEDRVVAVDTERKRQLTLYAHEIGLHFVFVPAA